MFMLKYSCIVYSSKFVYNLDVLSNCSDDCLSNLTGILNFLSKFVVRRRVLQIEFISAFNYVEIKVEA